MQEILQTTRDTTQICSRYQYPDCMRISTNGARDFQVFFQTIRHRVSTSWQATSLLRRSFMTVVLAHVTDDASIAKESTFGRVAASCSHAPMIRIFGLAGCVYTGDPHGSMRLTKLPDYDIVALGAPDFAGAVWAHGNLRRRREGAKRGLAETLEPKYACFANPVA